MSLSIKKIIELRMPELVTTPDPRLNDFITLAKGMTGQEFGDCYNQAVALRVLHWLAKEKQSGGSSSGSGSGNAGRVLTEKEDKLMVTYQKSSSNEWEDLNSTIYGSELIELMRSCLMLPRTRMGVDGYPFKSSLF